MKLSVTFLSLAILGLDLFVQAAPVPATLPDGLLLTKRGPVSDFDHLYRRGEKPGQSFSGNHASGSTQPSAPSGSPPPPLSGTPSHSGDESPHSGAMSPLSSGWSVLDNKEGHNEPNSPSPALPESLPPSPPPQSTELLPLSPSPQSTELLPPSLSPQSRKSARDARKAGKREGFAFVGPTANPFVPSEAKDSEPNTSVIGGWQTVESSAASRKGKGRKGKGNTRTGASTSTGPVADQAGRNAA